MSTEIAYYFQKTDRFPLPDFFEGLIHTWEIPAKAKPYLKALLTEAGVRENHGTCKGAPPALHGDYFIGEGTVIYDGVTILGPVYIGKNCEIMTGVTLRPGTILGDGCSVGHGSEIKRSVLMNGAKVASLAFVGDSVLGVSARIGSGVITANRKFDQSLVTVKIGGVKHGLHDDFFGCILGDSARLGANCVAQPGTHIGHHSWVYPLTCVRGFIPAGHRAGSTACFEVAPTEIVELEP